MLGICNGFQILCEAGLLPGVLRPNASLSFVCRDVAVRVERRGAAVHGALRAGAAARDPGQARRGLLVRAARARRRSSSRAGQIVLRYEPGENPNGAIADVAGVFNEDGNVMGLMPHPEHAVDPLLGSGDGALILASLVDAARDRMSRSSRRQPPTVRPQAERLAPAPGCLASSARSRSRSRARSVTGPRRARRPSCTRSARAARPALEQLHHRREPLLTRPLLDGELVDDGRRSPRCRARLCHGRQRSAEPVTCL